MSPTIFGLLIVLASLYLLVRGTTLALLQLVLFASLLGGSAAAILTSLGNSSIPPANVALAFLGLRCVLPAPSTGPRLHRAVEANALLALFALYGAIGAWVLPRLFEGTISVTPLRPDRAYIFATSPLHFSSQNVTVSLYLLGTLGGGIAGYVAGTRAGAERALVRCGCLVASIHAVLGFLSIPFGRSAFFSFFRNGFYAQLDQSIGSIIRMNGVFAEPANYAAYGVIWLVFVGELWLRDIAPRRSGPAFFLIAAALLASTSTTAYVGLAGFALAVVIRQFMRPGGISTRKLIWCVALGLAAGASVLAMLIVRPDVYAALARVVSVTLTDKLSSPSGQTRLFWARQGYASFLSTYGLGVGAGSFRSSSLLMAILGSMGVIGTVSFLLYLARVLPPAPKLREDVSAERRAVQRAAAWTALLMLLPAFVSAPSPDPGFLWAIFCGLALALRRAPIDNAARASPARRHERVIFQAQSDPATMWDAAPPGHHARDTR